ncbi:HAD family hydrolase [Paenibacillus sp. IB182496]|uniref:HAD family hydrolase n=1 Tax=Paenibacillus sabuli TaxID=2772509 RepID=A0A927GRT7_9BACL|nr:HAD-IA family hydrolase [Paenibacillus sabuli]MBD2845325.1 HAD family hydrolase [Paenibacillus sabuli]
MVKGIIFDMDNTLLRSTIDFASMKRDTHRFLVSHGVLEESVELQAHTTSTLIETAVQSGRMTDELLDKLWAIPKRYEVAGMQDADLEPGARELLADLEGRCRLAIVTNNAVEAAEEALRTNRIRSHFDCLVGRETTGAIKPAPDGFLHVLRRAPQLRTEEWLSVGDAWIDGLASSRAGIAFVAYQCDRAGLERHGVASIGAIEHLQELKHYL